MEVTNKRVLVFGSGISGIGAAGLLEDQGAQVVLYEHIPRLQVPVVYPRLYIFFLLLCRQRLRKRARGTVSEPQHDERVADKQHECRT